MIKIEPIKNPLRAKKISTPKNADAAMTSIVFDKGLSKKKIEPTAKKCPISTKDTATARIKSRPKTRFFIGYPEALRKAGAYGAAIPFARIAIPSAPVGGVRAPA